MLGGVFSALMVTDILSTLLKEILIYQEFLRRAALSIVYDKIKIYFDFLKMIIKHKERNENESNDNQSKIRQ